MESLLSAGDNCGVYLLAHGGSRPGWRTRRGRRREEFDSSRKRQRAAVASSKWRIMAREESPCRWCAHAVVARGQWKMTCCLVWHLGMACGCKGWAELQGHSVGSLVPGWKRLE
jgi:hypothetical protein